ncbi:MAG: sulfatase, partial [Verrucomicrobiota bacterium]|nr:sulfatase [Verrucomicrobiota bacterium]
AAKEGKIIQKVIGDARSGCDQWVPMLKTRPKNKPFFLWLAALDPHRDYDEGILENPHKPEEVKLPPYVADTPKSRKDYALYYDEITRLDRFVGEVMSELKQQGVLNNTFVLFISDNGRPFPRDKTTLYDSGIRTPFITHWPDRIKPGSKSDSLVSSIDIGPAFLELAGLSKPKIFEGRSFLPLIRNPKLTIHDYVFAQRNWHDYEDRVRAVRNKRFKYIRNFYDDLPNTPPADVVRSIAYREMIRLRDEGRLTDSQKNTFIQPRAKEELYDIQNDPFELRNLATDSGQAKRLNRFRRALAKWQQDTNDAEPPFRTLDEFGREDGQALPVRERPRPDKLEMTRQLREYYRNKAKQP